MGRERGWHTHTPIAPSVPTTLPHACMHTRPGRANPRAPQSGEKNAERGEGFPEAGLCSWRSVRS